ncbi:MAG: hypothetical protein ACOCSE_00500 [Chitinivibrionales bacterium]
MRIIKGFIITVLLAVFSFSAEGESGLKDRVGKLESKLSDLEKRVEELEAQDKENAEDRSKSSEDESRDGDTEREIPSPFRTKLLKKEVATSSGSTNFAFLIGFENTGGVGVESFSAALEFVDKRTGAKLLEFEADIDKPIKSGKKDSWYGGITYDPSDEDQVKLVKLDKEDVAVRVKIDRISYSDGSVIGE